MNFDKLIDGCGNKVKDIGAIYRKHSNHCLLGFYCVYNSTLLNPDITGSPHLTIWSPVLPVTPVLPVALPYGALFVINTFLL